MQNQSAQHKQKCTALTRSGDPCRAWAVPGTNPPRCASHGGVDAKPGAPVGNQNALKHGFYAEEWGNEPMSPVLETSVEEDPASEEKAVRSPTSEADATYEKWVKEKCARGEIERRPSSDEQTYYPVEILGYVVRDLLRKHMALGDYIEEKWDTLPLAAMSHLLALHAQTASRLGRLLRDQIEVTPTISDGLAAIIDQTLDEVGEMLGVEL